MHILAFASPFLLSPVSVRVPYRLRACALALALTALSGAAWADENEIAAPPAPALKPAPELTPPALRPPPGAPAKPAAPSPAPATTAPVARVPFAAGGGAIFFRADNIE
jgi:hypothetical protein